MKWGWIFTAATLLIPILVVPAIVNGARVISRSEGRRTVMGVAIIVTSVFVVLVSISIYAST